MPSEPIRMWQVFHFIAHYKTDNDGNSPTLADIAKHFGFNKTTAEYHLSRLMRRGRVRFDSHGRVILVGGVYEAPDQ